VRALLFVTLSRVERAFTIVAMETWSNGHRAFVVEIERPPDTLQRGMEYVKMQVRTVFAVVVAI
jgi:hypothetical protein